MFGNYGMVASGLPAAPVPRHLKKEPPAKQIQLTLQKEGSFSRLPSQSGPASIAERLWCDGVLVSLLGWVSSRLAKLPSPCS
jgi:hypothetical protein